MRADVFIVCGILLTALAACGEHGSRTPQAEHVPPQDAGKPSSETSSSGASPSATAAGAAATAPECQQSPMKDRPACNPAASGNPPQP